MSPISSRNNVRRRPVRSADALFVGARERALFVPEELRLEQVLLQRGAVDLDEAAGGSQRAVVHSAGDQLLAGAGLAAHEHRGVALGHALHDVEHAR